MRTLILKYLIACALFLSIPCALSAQNKEILEIATTTVESLRKANKRTVAVVDFTDLQGRVTELGRWLAARTEVALQPVAEGVGITVINRIHLKALLEEHKIAATGIIDPATARKVGQIAGVDVLVTGTITPFGDTVEVLVEGLDTATARVITSFSTNIPKTPAIKDLIDREVGSPPQISSAPVPRVASDAVEKEAHQFRFALSSCFLQGRAVTCRLRVTNTIEDRELALLGRGWNYTTFSFLIDGSGRQNDATAVQVGSSVSTSGWDRIARGTMVRGVPTYVSVKFDNVPFDISSIALLGLGLHDQSGDFVVQFRGIALQK